MRMKSSALWALAALWCFFAGCDRSRNGRAGGKAIFAEWSSDDQILRAVARADGNDENTWLDNFHRLKQDDKFKYERELRAHRDVIRESGASNADEYLSYVKKRQEIAYMQSAAESKLAA